MKFKILCLIVVILSEKYVSKHVVDAHESHEPEEFIRNLFLKNLEEDYRTYANEKLTPEIAKEISGRYKAFQDSRERRPLERSRKKRQANDEGAVYVLNGFQEAGSIPVNFPLDICLFKIVDNNYAAALHKSSSKSNDTILSIFRRDHGEFHHIFEYNTRNAHYMDCTFSSIAGFVAVANYIDESEDFVDAIEASSPVFRITSDEQIEIVLTFATPYQNSIHFWKYSDNIFLTHTYKYPNGTSTARKDCPIYIWSERQFTLIDHVKCLNSFHIERFEIDHEMYVAVANFEDDSGKSDIFSYIYKYDHQSQSFQQFQKIETHAADDIRHFEFTYGDVHDDYLIVANQFEVDGNGNRNYDTPSVIYKWINGFFVPLQSLLFDHVTHMQPVIGKNHEFMLLAACKNKPVKIYQYDGWNFVESTIDYTRLAFGDGVNKLRAYNNLANATIIAISNENHKAGDTNLYFPLYTLKNDISQIYKKFKDWVQATIDRLNDQNLQEILETLKKLPKMTDSDLTIYGKLELANAVVHKLDTWVLQTPSVDLNNDLVVRINRLHERIEQVKEQIRYLEGILTPGKEHVEVAVKKDRPPVEDQTKETDEKPAEKAEVVQEAKTEAPKPENVVQEAKTEAPEIVSEPQKEVVSEVIEVTDLYIKKNLKFKTINHQSGTKMLRTTPDKPLNLPKLKINGDVTFQDSLFVSNKIDGISFTPENLLLKTGNQLFTGNLDAETVVTDKLLTPFVNKEPTQGYLDKLSQENVAQSRQPLHFEEIEVDELYVNGFFNEMDIRIFDTLLLKPEGDQVLEAPFAINELKANDVVLLEGTLSGKKAQDLVSVKEGTYVIDSTVQFAHPIYAENLIVSERINNIHVTEGRMDVLLKEANYTQVVTGPKVFDTVHLLNPIGLQGKINSQSLEKMNPLTTIDHNLVLRGDFEINGDVLLKNYMQSSDIIGRSGEFSANRLFRHGLTLDTTHSDKYFTFTQPIRIDEVLTKPSETFNPDDFVKTGTDEIQYVTGYKTFPNDLTVKNGFCEANEINRISLDVLEKGVLKKTGDQVVYGRFHLHKLTSPKLEAREVLFENVRFDDLLTLDTPQTIAAPITIDANVKVLHTIEARNLFSNGDFAQGNLQYLVEDTVVNDGREYHITGEKTFENAAIDDLKFTLGTGKLNGIDMDTLVWDLDIFSDKYIHINDSLYQPKPLKIKNLHVTGAINGVNGEEFGKTWLLSEGDQAFEAPVTIDNLAVDDLFLDGTLNGHDLTYLYANTIWLNRDEILGNVEAIAVTAVDPVYFGGLFDGMNLHTDVLLKNSTYSQNVASLSAKSVEVKGDLTVAESLNGVNYGKLVELSTGSGSLNVKILGQTNFLTQPVFKTINDIDIDELYEHAWLSHRNAVLKATYSLDYAEFSHNIISTGLVNDLDLEYISKNYFSLTAPQDITGSFYFQNGTMFEHLKVDSVKLDGHIRGLNEKDLYVDINYFNNFAFKRGIEQEITGLWEIYELNVDGNLNDVLIDDYNFQNDVVRYDVPYNNITDGKFLQNLHVQNLVCAYPTCVVQDTDLSEWMSNSALIYGNYTIQGKTTVENVTVFGELRSVGPINGKPFDRSTILLKGEVQTLANNVFIRNKHHDRIIPIFFENLYVQNINGKNFNEMLQKTVSRHGGSSSVVSNLEVYEPLVVHHLHTKGNPVYNVNLHKELQEYDSYGDFSAYAHHFNVLENVGSYLERAVTRPAYYLSHLKLVKGIPGAFTDVLPLKLLPETQHLAAFDRDDSTLTIQFYRFNRTENTFVIDHFIPPLRTTADSGEQMLAIEIVNLNQMDHLVLETKAASGEFIQTSLGYFAGDGFQRIWRFNTTHPTKSHSLRLSGMDCILRYSDLVASSEIACLGKNGLFLYQKLEGAPISQVVTLGDGERSQSLIVLTADGNIVVYDPQVIKDHDKLTMPKQTLQPMNPSYIEAFVYDDFSYIAVCSDKTENAAHYGSVEIYRSKKDSEFTHFQTINIKIPLKVAFSKLESNDLLMYVLTNNPSQSIIVYQYTGAAGFKEFIASSTIPRGKGIQMVRMPTEKREILAIITEKDVMFVEPILKN